MKKPHVLVLSGYGFNCEEETAYAFELAGARAKIIHINDLISGQRSLKNFQILAFPGGFSYGDDTGSGKAFANRIKNHLWEKLQNFIKRDSLVIGICNGFQVMVNLGLLPGALIDNKSARYLVRWVDLGVSSESPWLKGIKTLCLPIAHGEGRFYAPAKTLRDLDSKNLVALQYVQGEMCRYQNLKANPNGSLKNIAGITDETGRLLGLMPHPERAIFFTQLPNWPLIKEKRRRVGQKIPRLGPGLQIFKNAVAYFQGKEASFLTYQQTGVDYSKMDPLKVMAQKAARATTRNLASTGLVEVEASRGESAYVVDCGDFYLASIVECLGTKALIADAMRKITGKEYYDQIAQDTIAMAVNDIATVGARPVSVHAYWAVGSSKWFDDQEKMKALVRGWKKACNLSGAVWGGGETPTLKGVIHSEAIDLAASCVGIIKPKKRLTLANKLKAGDIIIVFESSGIHANGLTLARKIADSLPKGYQTKIGSGEMYGEALLKPTIIYASLIQALFNKKVKIDYIANITGHGWRKIMRHPAAFTYRVTKLPPVPPVLEFMLKKGPVKISEAYGSLNMGAGLAIYVPPKDAAKALLISKRVGIKAYVIGKVEKGSKQVIIEPLHLIYKGRNLQLRG